MALLGPANQRGEEPQSGYFDPATGNPIPISEIGNFSFVKDAQGIFRAVTVDTNDLGEQFYEFNVADPSLLRDLGFLPKTGTGTTGRTQFESERQLQEAQAQRAADLTAIERQQLELDRQIQSATTQAERDRLQLQRDQLDLQKQQLQFEIDDAEAGRVLTREEGALDREALLKRERLGVLSSLISDFVGAQSQARTTLANLQPDQFAFAAAKGGITPFGTTPQQAFTQELQQTAGAPVPTIDPNASAQGLQAAINQLVGTQAPTAPTGFGGGLAGGGTIPFGSTQVRRVGERGPETMVVSTEGVTILPFDIGPGHPGFQTGGSLFNPVPFDQETLEPALAPLFSGLGQTAFTRPFTVQPTGETQVPSFGNLATFGIKPRILRDLGGGGIWVIGDDGVARHLTNPAALADIDPKNIIQATPDEIQKLATGGFGTSISQLPPGVGSAVPGVTPSAFTKFSSPIIEPTTGIMLPAPFAVAEQLNRLRVAKPFEFNLLLSAYKSAGVPVDAILGGVQSSLSFGQERGAVGLR